MTSKTFAATAFAATVLFSSCNWICTKKENTNKPFPSQVLWTLDSIISLKDTGSTANSFQARLNNAAVLKGSSRPLLRFIADSTLTTVMFKDTMLYHYYTDDKKQQVFIKTDTVYIPYHYVNGDSSLQLVAADSTKLFLSTY